MTELRNQIQGVIELLLGDSIVVELFVDCGLRWIACNPGAICIHAGVVRQGLLMNNL